MPPKKDLHGAEVNGFKLAADEDFDNFRSEVSE